ncbi:hypothetical protein LD125_00605 [Mesoplasma sp. JKS002658]|uniref:DnaD family protein n=1 Tax=Mesoplasma whartonense TaxID=2878854 RepID=UPI002022A983|nr:MULTISPECIES: DnaD family protein [unclassified Mesoplasma]MCL8211277.1 hypothetical protein [Mesoplasma sp. JKS002664]MCL8212130.1 hypothetical protein [Mesoplasma sp. JKS002662]MCL8212606.1 hypothetical protein [Mesoplasma sp. JKS002661]MCL8213272.1 hypothetical protein [Mesoplasma sp. JKS002660]MCL8214341.1 hypothetical protein [Mesoplasma sp. JKS002658]
MIVELLKKNLIDKKTFLLMNYQKVDLNELQLTIVLLTLELSGQNGGKKVVTSGDLGLYMSLSPSQIDNEMDDLIQKGLVKITSKSIDFTSLFLSIAVCLDNLEVEKFQNTQQDFFSQISQDLGENLTFEQISFLSQTIYEDLTLEQVLGFSHQKNINNFDDLRTKINQEISKKPKALFKYNWLNS